MKKAIVFFLVLALLSTFMVPMSLAQNTVDESEFSSYIVKLKEDTGTSARLFSFNGLDTINPEHGLYVSAGGEELKNLISADMVEYVEPNYSASLMGTVDDPYFHQQWNLMDIGIDDAWDFGLFGEGVRVAVIDSGINASHNDFAGTKILAGINVLTNSSDVTDIDGHGTFVSGIIAAQRNNGIGIAGITDAVEIVPIKCFHRNSTTDISYVIDAVYKAVDTYNCDVINLSLGLDMDVKAFREAISYAISKGVIVVSSVGNEGNSTMFYPAAYEDVIGVGSVGKNGEVTDFSQYNSSVFVTAPGEGLYSLGYANNDSVMIGSGTSFSTPHVSSMAIMAKSYDRSLSAKEFKQLLIDSSEDRGSAGYDTHFGHGYVEADKFLERMIYTPIITAAGRSANAKATVGSTVTVDMSGWFTGEGIEYFVYSDTADGNISFSGNSLRFLPTSIDAEKSIRIVVYAVSNGIVSSENAVLTVSVSGTATSVSANKFSDMSGHWAERYVGFGVDMGLLSGVTDNTFLPNSSVNRAMFTTTLARLSGEDFSEADSRFLDVSAGDWFAGAICWAVDAGIASGYGNGRFGPLDNITREQLAVLMYSYARSYTLSTGSYDSKDIYGFTDFNSTSLWAKDAMNWAVSNSLISGRTATTLDPSGTATRAEMAGVLLRFYNSFL